MITKIKAMNRKIWDFIKYKKEEAPEVEHTHYHYSNDVIQCLFDDGNKKVQVIAPGNKPVDELLYSALDIYFFFSDKKLMNKRKAQHHNAMRGKLFEFEFEKED